MSSTSTTTTTTAATSSQSLVLPKQPTSILLSKPLLSLTIPPTPSAESSKTSSPTGILETSTNSIASTSSLPQPNLNVKFAPLPELAPRKRKSSTPLGVAARGQLVRRRRGYGDPAAPAPVQYDQWTEEELAQHRMEQARSPPTPLEGDELGDPFTAFGRMMKGAGKTLWRRVSSKDVAAKKGGSGNEDSPTHAQGGGDELRRRASSSTGERVSSPVVVVGVVDSRVTKEDTGRVATLSETGESEGDGEEGRVWEEEIGQRFAAIGKLDGNGTSSGKMEVVAEERESVEPVEKTLPSPLPSVKSANVSANGKP